MIAVQIITGFVISAAIASIAAWLVTHAQRRREMDAMLARYEAQIRVIPGLIRIDALWIDGELVYKIPWWRRR